MSDDQKYCQKCKRYDFDCKCKFKSGGIVPGKSFKDRIPALISPGEWYPNFLESDEHVMIVPPDILERLRKFLDRV